MDCSLRGSSIHGIFQARVLEWGAIAFCDYTPIGGGKERRSVKAPGGDGSFWVELRLDLDLSKLRAEMHEWVWGM